MVTPVAKYLMQQSIRPRHVTLAARPEPEVHLNNFRVSDGPTLSAHDAPDSPSVLVESEILSLDPYVRARITDRPSYKLPIQLGDVIPGEALCKVLVSDDPAYAPGERVLAHLGWRSHAVVPANAVRPIPAGLTDSRHALGVMGMPGLTAFGALEKFGRMRSGETLVVAAATGPVGSMVGQLARRRGLRVVGIASGAEKCAELTDTLHFHAAVDRLDRNFHKALTAACPDGIDIDFETVGGSVFEAIMPILNRNARVLVCGLVSQWSQSASAQTPTARDLLRLALDRSLTVQGFTVSDFAEEFRDQFLEECVPLVNSGEIRALEFVADGLEKAPSAFLSMLRGEHIGKTLVRTAQAEQPTPGICESRG